MSGTKINDLMEMNGNQQQDDDAMVDSIINELNNDQHNSQQQMPQITPEEREMLMKQQMMEQQMMEQQKMKQMQMQQQQQMQMQQMPQMQQQQQMQQKAQQEKQEEEKKSDEKESIGDYIKNIYNFKDTLIIIVLTILLNLEPIDELLRFKGVSIFYDVETDKSTFSFFLLKSILIGVMFYFLQYLTK